MKKLTISTITIVLITFLFTSCFRYATNERDEVLLDGIDIDQSLIISEIELEDGGLGSVLTLWTMRDQIISPDHARIISDQYFRYIDGLEKKFNIWHFTWAISNLYRQGSPDVQTALEDAYKDASIRAAGMGGAADKHVNSQKIFMGDFHGGGRSYARKHLVVPGNNRYLQSIDEYLEKQNKE